MGLEDPRGSRGRRSGSQGVAQSQGVGYRVPAGQGVSPERSEGVKPTGSQGVQGVGLQGSKGSRGRGDIP